MNNLTNKLLIGGVVIVVISTVWVFWLRGNSGKSDKTTNGKESLPSAMTESGEQPAQPSQSSGQTNTQVSSDLEQQKIDTELQHLAESQRYKDLLARQDRHEQMTQGDYELLREAAEIKGRAIKEPHLKKCLEYPPGKSPEGIAMWQWYDKVMQTDGRLFYKRPISFYGKVVDDAGNSVADAVIFISIASPDGNNNLKIKSNNQGLFSIKNMKGKFLTVDMDKTGYGRGPKSFGTFEYAWFFQENFYEPDPNKPVVFILPRLKPKPSPAP